MRETELMVSGGEGAKRTCSLRLKTVAVPVILVLVSAVIVAYYLGFLFHCQIRADTGDLRFTFVGIPYRYYMMREPEREIIISVSKRLPDMYQVWITCERYPNDHGYGPLDGSNTEAMCYAFWRSVAAWALVDREVAYVVLKDLLSWVIQTNASHGLPECVDLLAPNYVDISRDLPHAQVVRNWRKDKFVVGYLRDKGLMEKLDGNLEPVEAVQGMPYEEKAEKEE